MSPKGSKSQNEIWPVPFILRPSPKTWCQVHPHKSRPPNNNKGSMTRWKDLSYLLRHKHLQLLYVQLQGCILILQNLKQKGHNHVQNPVFSHRMDKIPTVASAEEKWRFGIGLLQETLSDSYWGTKSAVSRLLHGPAGGDSEPVMFREEASPLLCDPFHPSGSSARPLRATSDSLICEVLWTNWENYCILCSLMMTAQTTTKCGAGRTGEDDRVLLYATCLSRTANAEALLSRAFSGQQEGVQIPGKKKDPGTKQVKESRVFPQRVWGKENKCESY